MAQGFTSGDATKESGAVPDFSQSSRSTGLSSVSDSVAAGSKEFNTTVLKVADSAIKFTDEAIKKSAEEDVKTEAEKIQADTRKEYFEYNLQKEATKSMPENTPQEIADKSREMSRLTDSYENGSLTSTHYWSRMDAMSRSLRARYPGYRDEIDNTVARFTGGKPANEVIGDILKEVAHNQKVDPNKEYQHYWDMAVKSGVPTVAAYEARGEKAPLPIIKRELAIWEARKAGIEAKRAEIGVNQAGLNLSQDIDKEGRSQTERQVFGALGSEMTMHLDRILEPLSLDRPEYADIISGKVKPSAEQIQNLASMSTKIRSQGLQAVEQLFNSPNFNGKSAYNLIQDPKRIQEIKQVFIDRINHTADAYQKGDFSILRTIKTYNETMSDGSEASMRQGNDFFNQLPALRKLGVPDPVVADLLGTNGRIRDKYERAIDSAFGGAVVVGNKETKYKSIGNYLEEATSKGSSFDFKQSALDKSLKLMSDTRMGVEDRSKFYQFLFGDSKPGSDLMSRLAPGEERRKMFASLTSTDGLNAIKKLEEERPGTMETFRKWVEHNGTVHMTKQMDTLNVLNQEKGPYLIGFNRSEGRFTAVENPGYTGTKVVDGTSTPTPAIRSQRARMEQFAADANRDIAVLTPALKVIAPPKKDFGNYVFDFLYKSNFSTLDPAGEKGVAKPKE